MNGDFELLHRRRHHSRPKSIVIPDSLHLDPLSPSPRSTNGSYTSLSDLIVPHSPKSNAKASSAAAGSPSAASVEIRIRNRLVKQAAYAYLQPTPSSTEASSRRRRRRFSLHRFLNAIGSCFGFIGRFFGTIWVHKRM